MKGKINSVPGINTKSILFFFLLACFLLLFSEFTLADATTEISKYFFTDDTFILNDKIGIITVDSYEGVIIDYDNSIIVVVNNTCKRVVNNDFCVDSIIYDTSKKKIKARLIVYYVGPDIELTRTINKSSPLVGEGVKVTVKLENKGNTSARNVTYIDIFPPKIEVLRVRKGYAKIEKILMWRNDTGSWQNMTRIFWQDRINVGKYHEIIYTLKPVTHVDSTFTAKAVYFNGIENVEIISSSVGIATTSFFEVSKKFAPTDYTVSAGSATVITGEVESDVCVGEEVLFITELKDKALKNETINVSYIDFNIPEDLLYRGPTSFRVYTNKSDANASYTPGVHSLKKVGENTYRWHGLMNPDGLIFAIKLKGLREGVKRLSVSAHLVQFKERKEPYYEPLYEEDYHDYEEIEVKLEDPIIESNFEEGKTFDSGQNAYFTIYMQNPNEHTNFTNIKVVLDTPWTKKNLTFSNLKKTNYVNFFDGFVTMPSVTESTLKSFSVNVTYETEYGDVYSEKLKRTISIKPHSPVKVSHIFSPSISSMPEKAVIDNKEVLVTLKLANTAKNKIERINVTEIVDPLLSKDGNLTRVVNIDKGVTMDVLKYKIDPPELKTKEEYRITTYVDYVAGNETYHIMKDLIVEVNVKGLTLGVSKSLQIDTATRGVPFYVDYLIENTAGETLENITILFPLTVDFDLVGNRQYSINRLGKGEQVAVIGEEKIRPKMNGSSIKLPKTYFVFHDTYGNEFTANSSRPTIVVLYKPLQSPALKVARNISKTAVNQSEKFTVTTTVKNIGVEKVRVTVNDLGRTWELEIGAGKEKAFSHEASEEGIGKVELPPAVVNYIYGGEMYYTASNNNEITVLGVEEEVVEVVEEVVEVVEEVVEEKKRPYIKYLALAIFVIIVCLIIFSVIKMKPKERGFEFLEE